MRWLKTKPVKGCYKQFTVEETIAPQKYSRTDKGVSRARKYWLVKVRKEGKTTEEMINILSKHYEIDKNDIGYAGLKDKHAVTFQYITLPKKCNPKKFTAKQIAFTDISECDKQLQIGNLMANNFSVKLEGNTETVPELMKELEKRGLPNLFGSQRFGVNNNNHIKGKRILEKRQSIYSKEKTKFLIHAYQSWVFNKVLKEYIRRYNRPYFKNVALVGYDTKLGNDKISVMIKKIMKDETIKQDMFMINELKLKCNGSERKLFVMPRNVSFDKKMLKFTLPKGSYGTVLLKEFGVEKC